MSAPAAARACTATEASAPNVASKAQLPPEVLFPVSSKVEALDEAGTWYEAKVVDERGQGAAREYLVHYIRWKSRYDEWMDSGRLRAVDGAASRVEKQEVATSAGAGASSGAGA